MIYLVRWYFYVCLFWVSQCFRRALWSFSRFCTLELNLYTHISNKDWIFFHLHHLSPCFQTLNTPPNISVNIGNHRNHDYSDYQTKLTLHSLSFQLHLHISCWDCELFSVVCSNQSFAKKKKKKKHTVFIPLMQFWFNTEATVAAAQRNQHFFLKDQRNAIHWLIWW